MLLEAFINGILLGALAAGFIGYKFTVKPMRDLIKKLNEQEIKVQK